MPFSVYGGPRSQSCLRIVVLAPARAPAWLAATIEHLAGKSWIALGVGLLPTAGNGPAETPLALDVRLFLALERLRRRGDDGQLACVDLAARTKAAGVEVRMIANDADLRGYLLQAPADLLIAAAGFAVAAQVATGIQWGCWQVGGDLADPWRAGLALLPPLLDGEPVTPTCLRLQAPSGMSLLLASSTGATQGGAFALQRDLAFRKLPALLARALRDLVRGTTAAPERQVLRLQFGAGTAPLPRGAGVRALRRVVGGTLRWWRDRWHGQEMWFVAVRRAPVPIDPALPQMGVVSALVGAPSCYWADPFLYDDDGRPLLFVEEYGLRDQRGVIACVALRPDGSARRLGIALDEACHLSYPQVFSDQGTRYMTVESGSARRVRLYREAGFPLQWEPVADLIDDCVCVDPTLYRHAGRWYLFVNISDAGAGSSDELFLFSADALTGPYRAHPCNPIVKDVRCARSAGPLFMHAGRLIRPAQDCAPDYGIAVVFNEVTELTPTTYSERRLARLDAAWMPGSKGCHTYAAIAGLEVFDAKGRPARGVERMTVDDALVMTGREGVHPLVSVIMPVYNGVAFLGQAIDSVLAQTLREFEVIVVDDGSSDGSGELADRYAREHPQHVRVVHQENQGLPLARNAAIAVARGRYLALLDADDLWLPGHLAACVGVLESHSSVGLVHADTEDIDASGQVLAARVPCLRWPRRAARDPFRAMLLRRQNVACLTAVFRRSVVERVGGFDPRFNRLGSEDRDMWLRIAEVSDLVYLDELHAHYRVHGNNMSANAERMWRAQRLLVDKFSARPRARGLHRRALAAVDAELGHQLAVERSMRPALRMFMRALANDPLRVDAWKGLVRRIFVGPRSRGSAHP